MKALFVGLATLDIIQIANAYPVEDSKNDSDSAIVAAGGPAANAAIAFAHSYMNQHLCAHGFDRKDDSILVTRISDDEIGRFIRDDLESHDVEILGFPIRGTSSAVSSIAVNRQNGSRTIISTAGIRDSIQPKATLEEHLLDDVDIVVADGYEADISLPLMDKARKREIPVVLDIGRERENSDDFICLADCVISSSTYKEKDFENALEHVSSLGARWFAMTDGENRIRYSADGCRGESPVPHVRAIDTLGAGDFFHGAFAKAVAGKPIARSTFIWGLEAAAATASKSTEYLGTRSWLSDV